MLVVIKKNINWQKHSVLIMDQHKDHIENRALFLNEPISIFYINVMAVI